MLILFFSTNISSVTAQGGLATSMLLPQQPQASPEAWAIPSDWYPRWSWMIEIWVGQEQG